ncbi:histidine kinase [Skermanella stibiiresistens SB22]|uniref:histidine kinase n=1 Tax=Skermanella stibiiresistens SB22 TaxID=1385369 RepID=W9H8V1_9PROT|nr:ATP-binding protein [Skermanella stibiiresistens]EWY40233.1 histidine kinase [Skermanella stibiiresistens SB22]
MRAARIWNLLAKSRFMPGGIAVRLGFTVLMALALTQGVSALVYLTDAGEGPPRHGPGRIVERVAAITRLADETPPQFRPRVVRAVDAPGLEVEWRPKPPEFQRNQSGFPFDGFRRRVRQALGDSEREILIEVRNGPPSPGPLAPAEARLFGNVMRMALPLSDGTWLTFRSDPERDGPFRLLRFGLWMGLVGLVIFGLSIWVGRLLSAPLKRFAEAAHRLGVDGEAPLLPETGPRELRQATRAFNQMQTRLHRFVEDRTQMLAAISHDLRTPLTRLRLRAEFVDDPEQQRKMLADLEEMEAMITSTLAFARDDARKEPRVSLDLAAMLESLVDDLGDAGFAIEYAGPQHRIIGCRPMALRRAIGNLIDNALKYGGGARVTLLEQREDGQVAIRIDDDGPGIPVEEQEKVFAPFYRLERSRSRDTGGTGLGLSVARTIARAHGGDVTLLNRPGGGLSATLILAEA